MKKYSKAINQMQENIKTQHSAQNSQVSLNKTLNLSTPLYIVHKEQNSDVIEIEELKENVQCRICLQNPHQSIEPFIKPCQCTGSVMHVHQKCFTEWLRISLKEKNNKQLKKVIEQGMQCQLCKMKFSIRISYQKTFINWQKFKEKVKYHKAQFITLCTFLITSIILLTITSVLMPSDVFVLSSDNQPSNPNKSHGVEKWIKILLICCVFVLIGVILFIGYMFVDEYMFSYRMQFEYKGKQIKTLKGILDQ